MAEQDFKKNVANPIFAGQSIKQMHTNWEANLLNAEGSSMTAEIIAKIAKPFSQKESGFHRIRSSHLPHENRKYVYVFYIFF